MEQTTHPWHATKEARLKDGLADLASEDELLYMRCILGRPCLLLGFDEIV